MTAYQNRSEVKIRRHTFHKSEEITIEIPKKSIFIQTDKPIYKPGQTGNVNTTTTLLTIFHCHNNVVLIFFVHL